MSNQKVVVTSKGYVVEHGTKYIARLHITYGDTLIEVDWKNLFETRDKCAEWLMENASSLTQAVCNEIGLEAQVASVFCPPNKTQH